MFWDLIPVRFRPLVAILLVLIVGVLMALSALFTPAAAHAATGGCGEELVDCPVVVTVDQAQLDQLMAENAALKVANDILSEDNDTIHMTNEVLQQQVIKLERDYKEALPKARAMEAGTVIFIAILWFVTSAYAALWFMNRRLKRDLKIMERLVIRTPKPKSS